jgi:hypothetical protein
MLAVPAMKLVHESREGVAPRTLRRQGESAVPPARLRPIWPLRSAGTAESAVRSALFDGRGCDHVLDE